MKTLFSKFIVTLLLVFTPFALNPALTVAAATSCPNTNTAQGQALQGIGETGSDCSSSGIDNALQAAVAILSYIAGVAAVIMILYSGIRYTTSGGDAGKVSAAKNALVYALVGVIVAGLAQGLIHFVLNTSSNAATPCSHVVKDAQGHVIHGLSEADAACK